MRARFWGFAEDIDITTRDDLRDDEIPQTFLSTRAALEHLRRLTPDAGAMRRLRHLADFTGRRTGGRLGDRELLESLAVDAYAQRLFVVVTPRTRVVFDPSGATVVDDLDPSPTEEPAASEPAPVEPVDAVEHWIAFQLLDDETEAPVAGAQMRVTLGDGSERTYTTDAEGVIHIEGVPPGACDLDALEVQDFVEIVRFA